MTSATPVAEPPPSAPVQVAPTPWAGRPAPRLTKLPIALIALLFAFLGLPRVQQNAHVFYAFLGTASALLVWQVALWLRRRPLLVEYVPPVKQHYVQACVQLCLYAYWGWYWVLPDGVKPIYAQAPLIVAQAVFLYAFDALFAWSRGRTWRLASGPLPIVLSTNLFIWFRDDWFVWQFAMITVGLLGKEFVKWHKEGRRTHVFNPSGFGLAVTAIVLIVTGNVDLTWAKPLATTIENPPYVFVFLFALGLVVQGFFAVTLMTFAAAVVMVLINLGYTAATGVYLFASTNLPAAAFLGLMLLMTDPSTSPRSNLGRTIFGAGYGLGYVVMFQLLGMLGAPELFAKLFPVPILNVGVQWLDRLAHRGALGRLNARWQTALSPRAMNQVHMALWSAVFAVMVGTGYVQGPHPGDSIAFWKQALRDGKPEAGRKLVMVAGSRAVGRGDASAFNELGIASIEGKIVHSDERTALKSAAHWWAEAAARGSLEACENIVAVYLFLGATRSDQELTAATQRVHQAAQQGRPRSCFLLGFAHEVGVGLPPDAARSLAYYRHAGADDVPAHKGIARLALRPTGSGVDVNESCGVLARAVAAGDGESAWLLAYLQAGGRDATASPQQLEPQLRARAEELGWPPAAAARGQPQLPPFALPERRLMAPPWSSAFPIDG